MNGVLNVFWAMLAKDLRRELRSREIFISGFLFSVIMLVVIYFATSSSDVDFEKMGAGGLWLCIVFSGTIGLNRIHHSEMANGCYRSLILAPVDGGWLYLAKTLANMVLLGFTTLLLMPLMVLFFRMPIFEQPWWLFAGIGLGLLGFVAVGTLVVAIAANTRMKDVLFPMVQLPLVVPALVAGVNATTMALEGEAPTQFVQFLAAYNVVFLSIGFLLYEFLLEE